MKSLLRDEIGEGCVAAAVVGCGEALVREVLVVARRRSARFWVEGLPVRRSCLGLLLLRFCIRAIESCRAAEVRLVVGENLDSALVVGMMEMVVRGSRDGKMLMMVPRICRKERRRRWVADGSRSESRGHGGCDWSGLERSVDEDEHRQDEVQ